MVDVPRISLDDVFMPTEEQRKTAGLAVRNRRIRKGMTPPSLGRTADVDAKTVRSLEAGERWPQEVSRAKIEEALDWEIGTIERIASGEEPSGVESETDESLNAKERHPALGLQAIDRDRAGYDADDLWQRLEDAVDLAASIAMRGADPDLCHELLKVLGLTADELARLTSAAPPHSYEMKMRTIPLMVNGLRQEQGNKGADDASQAEDQTSDHQNVQGAGDRAPIDLAQARRVKDDPAAFGDQPRQGDLDQGKLQPPPAPEKSAAWRTRNRGKEIRDDHDDRADD